MGCPCARHEGKPALDIGEWSASRSAQFTPTTHTVYWMRPTPALTLCSSKTYLSPSRNRTTNSLSRSPQPTAQLHTALRGTSGLQTFGHSTVIITSNFGRIPSLGNTASITGLLAFSRVTAASALR